MISNGERAGLLGTTDVFVAPHRARESFGIVLLEAMASGAPIVASDLPAFVDLLRDGDDDRLGELFPAGDPDRLAAAVISTLADRPAVRQRAGRARSASRIDRDRGVAVWKVATTGAVPAHRASIETLGVIGSCRCSRSKSPSRNHCRTRAALTGPKFTRATEPLYGTGTAGPAEVNTSGGSPASARLDAINASGRPGPRIRGRKPFRDR